MAKNKGNPKGNPQNLDPVKTHEEAVARGRAGGIKSGEARRKQKAFNTIYGEMLADEYKVAVDGVSKIIDGRKLIKIVARDVLLRRDSASVAMLESMKKSLDGESLEIEATVEQVDATEGMTYEQKKKLAEEWLAKHR